MPEPKVFIKGADLDLSMFSRGFLSVFGLLKLADEVCEEAFRRIGFGKPRAQSSGETLYTAAAHVDVSEPIGLSRDFFADVEFSELGNKKIITKARFRGREDVVLAEVETVHVCYDLNERVSIAIPSDIREKIEQLNKR